MKIESKGSEMIQVKEGGKMITKGEWKVYLTNRQPQKYTICAGDEGEQGIAQTVLDASIPPAERKANANLIAAAPDLYEALKELREWIQSDDVKFLVKGFTEQFGIPKTLDKVDKAITKAEGK